MIDWVLAQVTSAQFVSMVISFTTLGALELLFPLYRVPARRYFLNIAYVVANFFIGALLAPLIATATVWALRDLLHVQGLVALTRLGLSGVGGALVAVLLAMLINDIFFYWFHRAQHGSKVLWQEHLVHHCDEYMNVTTGPRIHIAENVVAAVLVTLPIGLLFSLPSVEIAAVTWIPYLLGYFAHSNLRLGFGPVWWLMVSPQYHRIHHSIETAHQDKNFAAWFPIIDIIFGTAYRPKLGEYPRSGVPGVTIDAVHEAFLFPLRQWARMATRPAKTFGTGGRSSFTHRLRWRRGG